MAGAETSPSDGKLLDLGIKLVGGTAAGIGVLGFVTVVGGAVSEAQLAGAGLPATRILAEIPRTDLLVVGARLLIPFVGALGLQILLLRLIETAADDARRLKRAPRSRIASVVALSLAGLLLTVADARSVDAPWWVWLLGLVVSAAAVTAMYGARCWSFAQFVALEVVVAAVATVSCGYALAYALPDVRPVAVLVRGAPPIIGIYAAVNSDEVAVGEVCTDGRGSSRGDASDGSVVFVPRSAVTAIAVGTNSSLTGAIEREVGLLQGLSPAAVAQLPRPGPPYASTALPGRATYGQLCSDAAAVATLGTRERRSLLLGP